MTSKQPARRVDDLIDALGFRASANPHAMAAAALYALATIVAHSDRASITLKDLLVMAEEIEARGRRPFEVATAPLRGARDAGMYLTEIEVPARFWGSVPADSNADAIRRAVAMVQTDQREDLAVTFGQPTYTAAEKRAPVHSRRQPEENHA